MHTVITVWGELSDSARQAVLGRLCELGLSIESHVINLDAPLQEVAYCDPSDSEKLALPNNFGSLRAITQLKFEEFWRNGLHCSLDVAKLMAEHCLGFADHLAAPLIVGDLEESLLGLGTRIYNALRRQDIVSVAMVQQLSDGFFLNHGFSPKSLAIIRQKITR